MIRVMNETKTKSIKTASKDILARLLASEDIAVEHRAAAQTASFNTKSRVLVLPIWENMDDALYDMLVGHEVAHALWTPTDEWSEMLDRFGAINRGVWMTFVNIVEDARIERKIKDKFPGLRRDFFHAYADLFERDIFEIEGKDLNDLPLIDRLNLHFKIGPHTSIPFDASEQKWISAVDGTKSFADVIEVAADLFQQWLDEQPESPQDEEQQEQSSESASGVGEGPESDSDATSTDDNGESDDTGEGQGSSGSGDDGDEDGEDAGSTSGSGGQDDSSDDCGQSMTDDTDTGESADSTQGENQPVGDNTEYSNDAASRGVGETQNAFDRAVEDMADENARDREYYSVPKCNLDNAVVDYKTVHEDIAAFIAKNDVDGSKFAGCVQRIKQFENESRKTINMMAQQFIRRQSADEAHRTSIAKTGILDMGTLHSYQWNEDVFLRNEEIADGKNHGLVVFVDWSGSMSDIMEDTIKQMVQMVFFCKKVGIPFEVYSFTSSLRNKTGVSIYDMTDEQRAEYEASTKQWGDEVNWLQKFNLNNYFSSRMTTRELKQALAHMQWICDGLDWHNGIRCPHGHDLGCTPLNEAIVAAMDIVPEFRERNRLQIVNTVFLTDGEASNRLGYYGGGQAWLRDDQTKRSYECGRRGTTGACLTALSDRTGAKTVGIYLSTQKQLRYGHTDEQALNYKKEGFTSTDKAGYTEYFIVKANKKVENDYMDNIDSEASYTKIKNAFIKSSSNRVNSRVLLNRVIDLIAT